MNVKHTYTADEFAQAYVVLTGIARYLRKQVEAENNFELWRAYRQALRIVNSRFANFIKYNYNDVPTW